MPGANAEALADVQGGAGDLVAGIAPEADAPGAVGHLCHDNVDTCAGGGERLEQGADIRGRARGLEKRMLARDEGDAEPGKLAGGGGTGGPGAGGAGPAGGTGFGPLLFTPGGGGP